MKTNLFSKATSGLVALLVTGLLLNWSAADLAAQTGNRSTAERRTNNRSSKRLRDLPWTGMKVRSSKTLASWSKTQDEDQGGEEANVPELEAPLSPQDQTEYTMELLNKPLADIELDIGVKSAEHPADRSADLQYNDYQGSYPRPVSPRTVYWRSAEIRYQPLYFEDPLLERYGQSAPPLFQPYVSAAHFFVSANLLPLNMFRDPPGRCRYPLGYFSPGQCTPLARDTFLFR